MRADARAESLYIQGARDARSRNPEVPMRIPTMDHIQHTAVRFIVSLLAALLALAVLAPSSAGS
jgi:hypothetical protein